MIIDIISGILLIAGAGFMLIASIGLVRLPDLLMRMHASTKAGTLGAGLILLGVSFAFTDTAITARVLTIIVFILLTAPVAAHLIGRAAYYVGMDLWKGTVIDELKDEVERQHVDNKSNIHE
ncbi:MAG: monovalent cation/H(+) antiporter subunit G [Balneolales bacterium]